MRPTCRGGSGEVWRGHGVEMRGRLARAALLYTIGYEVAVTCSRPTDDRSVTRPRSTIPGFPRTLVGTFKRSGILDPTDSDRTTSDYDAIFLTRRLKLPRLDDLIHARRETQHLYAPYRANFRVGSLTFKSSSLNCKLSQKAAEIRNILSYNRGFYYSKRPWCNLHFRGLNIYVVDKR